MDNLKQNSAYNRQMMSRAIYYDNLKIVKKLIKRENFDLRGYVYTTTGRGFNDRFGKDTKYQYASKWGIEWLDDGYTALMLAIYLNRMEIALYLDRLGDRLSLTDQGESIKYIKNYGKFKILKIDRKKSKEEVSEFLDLKKLLGSAGYVKSLHDAFNEQLKKAKIPITDNIGLILVPSGKVKVDVKNYIVQGSPIQLEDTSIPQNLTETKISSYGTKVKNLNGTSFFIKQIESGEDLFFVYSIKDEVIKEGTEINIPKFCTEKCAEDIYVYTIDDYLFGEK